MSDRIGRTVRVPLLACPAVFRGEHCWASQQWHSARERASMKNIGLRSIAVLLSSLMVLVPGTARSADQAVLHLANGGFLAGELRNSKQDNLVRWKSPLFTQDFEFPTRNI